jgi:ABC-type sugar transport system ATPase subunit
MAELIVKDVALRLGDNEILKGVSLSVPAGEVVALLGPSGSGKTTLLRAIAGLETPHQGSIAIGDTEFFDAARAIDLPAEKRGLGLVFQSYALWPHRTVFDNVAAASSCAASRPRKPRPAWRRLCRRSGSGISPHAIPISFQAGSSSASPSRALSFMSRR